jgi:hypothetical protein
MPNGFKAILIGFLLLIFFILSYISPYFTYGFFKADYRALISPNFGAGDLIPSIKAIKLWRSSSYNYDFYNQLWFDEDVYHTWSPSAMLFYLPFSFLSEQNLVKFWNILLRILTLLTALMVPLIFSNVIKLLNLSDKVFKSINDRVLISGALFLISLSFYPLMRSLAINQVQTVITFLQALFILFLTMSNLKKSSVILGLIASIKVHYGIAFIWFLINRKWKALISGLSVFLGMLIAGALVYGPSNTLTFYFKVIPFISGKGYAYYPNQSLNGLFNRLFFNGYINTWLPKYTLYHPVVYALTIGGAIVLLGLGFLPSVMRHFKREKLSFKQDELNSINILELMLILIVITISSPIAWEHNYGCFLPIAGGLFPFLFSSSSKEWLKIVLFFISWLVISFYWNVHFLAQTYFNILMSYNLFGAIIFIILIWWEYLILYKKGLPDYKV